MLCCFYCILLFISLLICLHPFENVFVVVLDEGLSLDEMSFNLSGLFFFNYLAARHVLANFIIAHHFVKYCAFSVSLHFSFFKASLCKTFFFSFFSYCFQPSFKQFDINDHLICDIPLFVLMSVCCSPLIVFCSNNLCCTLFVHCFLYLIMHPLSSFFGATELITCLYEVSH